MFTVIEENVRTFWAATDGASTYYKGQIVMWNNIQATHSIGTVIPLIVASGAYDTTLRQCIAGVVVGFNNRTQTYTTLGSMRVEYGGGACATKALEVARDWTGAEGMYSKGDPQCLVQVAAIFPNTMIRGPIFNAAYGTAPTELALTVVTGDGLVTAGTTASNDAASILNMGTIYFRTGLNTGLYRVNKNTSITAPSVTTAFPYTEAVGDKIVAVPIKQGQSAITISTNYGNYINCGVAPVADGTGMFGVNVYKLDLSTAGREYADFTFMADHFARARA